MNGFVKLNELRMRVGQLARPNVFGDFSRNAALAAALYELIELLQDMTEENRLVPLSGNAAALEIADLRRQNVALRAELVTASEANEIASRALVDAGRHRAALEALDEAVSADDVTPEVRRMVRVALGKEEAGKGAG